MIAVYANGAAWGCISLYFMASGEPAATTWSALIILNVWLAAFSVISTREK